MSQPGFVERDGASLHYIMSGRIHAPTVLLINSLGASLEMWEPQLAALERSFRVVRFDARGHGKSTYLHEAPMSAIAERSIADYGADALAVLDALRIERAHWVGLSFGGMVSMWAASQAPASVGLASISQRVNRLVLANTTAFMPPRDRWDGLIATLQAGSMDPIADAIAERWFTEAFRRESPDAVGKIVAMVRGTQPRGYAEACTAIRDMDQRESISAITASTLVIAGTQDVGTTLEHAEGLTARIRSADLAVLDSAHLSNVEQADDFTEVLMDFLSE